MHSCNGARPPLRLPSLHLGYNISMTPFPLLSSLTEGLTLTGDVARDVPIFLNHHVFPGTARHCAAVSEEAGRLAERFGADPQSASTAGWLHDVSAVIGTEWLSAARQLGVEVLPAELLKPILLHQKISGVLAREIFSVKDPAILAAIGCHTTLHPHPTPLEMVVFVADKLAWDQAGAPPYQADLLAGLDISLERGAWVYLDYLWQNRERLVVLHPWAEAAWQDLK